jgi:hypothetical protein
MKPPRKPLAPKVAALIREAWWLAAVGAAVFLAMILGSYHVDDPGWSRTGLSETLHNAGADRTQSWCASKFGVEVRRSRTTRTALPRHSCSQYAPAATGRRSQPGGDIPTDRTQAAGVEVTVLAAYPGPVVTRYEIEPASGVKGSQITNLSKDLARALALVSIRVVETIPGKVCMALELPNSQRQIVRLSEILGARSMHDMPRR